MHRGSEGGDLALWWVKVEGFCTEWDFLLSWIASIARKSGGRLYVIGVVVIVLGINEFRCGPKRFPR